MPDHPQLDAPVTLTGLFGDDSDDSASDENDGGGAGSDEPANKNSPTYEVQELDVAGMRLKVRQFDFHSHNANRVWPGALRLADYLLRRDPANGGGYARHWGTVLELGTATGLLAIRLALSSAVHGRPPTGEQEEDSGDTDNGCSSQGTYYCCDVIVTSDVQVDDGEDLVARNLRCNYDLNGVPVERRPLHVPHTWGSGWEASARDAAHQHHATTSAFIVPHRFDTVVASDILLYVSAYPSLARTIDELLVDEACQMVMSWNRRMKESREFFDRWLPSVGLEYRHEGSCIYTIRRQRRRPDPATSTVAIEPEVS